MPKNSSSASKGSLSSLRTAEGANTDRGTSERLSPRVRTGKGKMRSLVSTPALSSLHSGDSGTNHVASIYKGLLDKLFDGVYSVDCDRRITYWNEAAERITGYSASEVLGTHCFDNILVHVDDEGHPLCCDGCPLTRTLADSERREVDVYLRHRQGHRIPVSVRVSAITDEGNRVTGAVEVFSNITAKKRTERRVRELEGLAFQDSLTGIANRQYAQLKVEHAMLEVDRFRRRVGLLLLDLNRFKEINDTYGHSAGDSLLRTVCRTLSENTRSGNMVARWGGDEFLMIVKDVSKKGLQQYGDRLLNLVANSASVVGKRRISVTVSIGATMLREGETSQSAIERADALMYSSKSSGKAMTALG